MRNKEFEIIDVHTHATGIDILNFFTPRIPSTQSLAELKGKMEASGITRAVVFPFPGTLYYNPKKILLENVWEATGLEDFPYQQENLALMAEIRLRQWESSLLPFLAFDPIEKVDQQCRYLARESGYYGIKIHTLATRSSPADVSKELISMLVGRNMPVLFHTGKQENALPQKVVDFAKINQKLRVGLAHLGGLDSRALHEAIKVPNLFVDTSPFLCICYFAQHGIRRYLSDDIFQTDYGDPTGVLLNLSAFLGDKLIWGSDEPFSCFSDRRGIIVTNFSYAEQVEVLKRLETMGYSEVLRKIVEENPKRFLFG
ncbi:hypothetical protein COV89_03865 [Candidatus Shapirobacteria bacterium CG11_big_fil_rev_8_21_14_0_20_40_12]|uniref:Amidohydrolase-related domain-containing protein n=1 Tax=Candidatus Shapirobacteria bacterium CG11_big_fil_rev_8_21_14_0_20_40_12 TaxID=1974889 RepID=A0A2H0KEW1_9BACT|nr:MAG: hypothetical protein COV89_03865 [Candidatus Shapirobacteria bacterium CG11_big_fil_rev_8_21_14_0_20_40_12]